MATVKGAAEPVTMSSDMTRAGRTERLRKISHFVKEL
jgi:hypothetical protein